MHHLVERRGNEAAQAYHVYLLGNGALHDGLGGYHNAQVDDIIAIAGHDDGDDVLADVVDVALHSGQQHASGRSHALGLLGLDSGLQDGDGFLHSAGSLHHLGEEHLAGTEEVAHVVHARHQRAFDDVHGLWIFFQGLGQVFFQVVADAFGQGVGEAFLQRAAAPSLLCGRRSGGSASLLGFLFGLQAFGGLDEALGGVGAAVQDDVLDALQHVGGDVGVEDGRGGVDDTHIHTLADGVVEEDGVHGLADVVVAAERERQVADAATNVCAGQVAAYPARGADEVDGVVVVLLHARGHGQDVGVEDNVRRTEASFIYQQAVSPAADGNAAFVSVGLPLLVKSHHHRGGAQATDEAGMFQEFLLAFLQRDGVDDGLALHALQSSHDDVPLRGVYHHRHAGNLGLGGYQVEEGYHLFFGIKQAVVHVDVDDLCPVLHLTAGDTEGFLVVFFINEPQELARAGHVATLAHVDEVVFGLHLQQFEAGEPEVFRRGSRRMGSRAFHQSGEAGDVFFGRAAAAADDVHQALADVLAYLAGHVVGRLVVLPQAVGQAGIGIGTDVIGSAGGQLLQEGFQLAGAERTVQAHGEDIGMLHGSQEGVQRLAGQGTPCSVGNSDGEHQRHAASHFLHRLLRCIEGSFGIKSIEDGLDEQSVHPTLQQGSHLLAVGVGQVVEGQGTVGGIAHVGAHGAGLVRGAHRACHEARLLLR